MKKFNKPTLKGETEQQLWDFVTDLLLYRWNVEWELRDHPGNAALHACRESKLHQSIWLCLWVEDVFEFSSYGLGVEPVVKQ